MDTCETSEPLATTSALLDALLDEQQSLSAVEQFARTAHADGEPLQARYYRDLIPATTPGTGQQYAFEVDLDACSGCKACVAACHNLNGLEDAETWRDVGLLVGGTSELPVLQHVTTACHHCVEPACLSGCPVEAYEKDPVTGIVRHLDDQCIGCQYCILKCPYDVPQYSKSKGIVRKCDMCSDRLATGEAPACVQSCPNQAIRISIVAQETVLAETETNQFLPGAPDPRYTIPTTVYKTKEPLPRGMLPADYFSSRCEHSHMPLVVMLVLTQMSVGAFVVEQAMFTYVSLFRQEIAQPIRSMHLLAALMLGGLGLAASVFHLGRPMYAFRAWIGVRTSWLSREIVAFGLFAGTASIYVATACLEYVDRPAAKEIQVVLGMAAALMGLVAVACSVMVYVDTRRPFWTPGTTSVKFLLTALLLGVPVVLIVSLLTVAASSDLSVPTVMHEYGQDLCRLLVAAAITKMLVELSVFRHLRARQHTPLKRTALLMTGELGITVMKRFFFGVMGGVVLPLVLLAETSLATGAYHPLFVGILTVLILLSLSVGELLERYLFFVAAVAPRMPGAVAT